MPQAGSDRPRAQLTTVPQTLAGTVIAAAGTVIAAVQLQQAKNDAERAKRDSERAFRESPEGRLQEAVRALMRPRIPTKMPKEQVVQRKAALLRLF